jgi:HTH-type transcriptional regulator/antitoxin HigA
MNRDEPHDDMPGLAQAWSTLQQYAPLKPIRTEADFERVHELADKLAIAVGANEDHPLYSLFELVMTLIEEWEDEHVSLPKASPREVLRYLLEEHDLKQKDLEDIASPTLISDILAGRREISKRLAKSLAERFHVGIGAFI